jgi:hypothetical protein
MEPDDPFAFMGFLRSFDAISIHKDEDIFSTPDLTLPNLPSNWQDVASWITPRDSWQILPQPITGTTDGIAVDSIPGLYDDTQNPEFDSVPDVWALESHAPLSLDGPRLKTWEAFTKRDVVATTRTTYMSEAGDAVFDAALASENSNKGGVLPTDASIRALRSLAIGRSSILFQWQEDQQRFEQSLPDLRLSGLTGVVSQKLIDDVLAFATEYRRSQGAVDPCVRYQCKSAAHLALTTSVESVIDSIEAHLMQGLTNARSLLQIHNSIEQPRELVGLLTTMLAAAAGTTNDEATISALSDIVSTVTESGNHFASLLWQILNRVAQPWLERLAAELGVVSKLSTTASEDTIDNGDDFADSLQSANPATSQIQDLLSDDDAATIHDTRETVKLLRSYLPEVLQQIEAKDSSLGLSTAHQQSDPNPEESAQNTTSSIQDVAKDHFHGLLDFDLDADPNSFPTTEPDGLSAATSAMLCVTKLCLPTLSKAITSQDKLDLLGSLRPTLQQHSRRLSRALLNHLFGRCQMRNHLNLQRSFHLLGSGAFVTRLTTALFSSETQSAERRRGITPTAQTMGLRLGVRDGQRWPPASSELRLTLLGVLTEAYLGNADHNKSNTDLPGGLSFAIRELPDDEIDLVMDPMSLYALDFLKLQYAAPAPLDAILTPASMQKYDEMFRFLLRLLRVLDLTTRLHTMYVARTTSAHRSTTHALIEAHRVAEALMSYTMEFGIAQPWAKFMRSIDGVEYALQEHNDDVPGLTQLRNMHHECLDETRSRLFLRRRQQDVRTGMEDVLNAVLKLATLNQKLPMERTSSDGQDAGLRESIVSFLRLLHAKLDRSFKTRIGSATEGGDEDDERLAIKLLLAKLNWNEYYHV